MRSPSSPSGSEFDVTHPIARPFDDRSASDTAVEGDRPAEARETALAEARRTASGATEESKAIVEVATEGTQQVMEEVGNQARQVVEEVGAQIKNLAEQGQAQLRLQAEQQTQRASKNLWTLAEQAEALADGRVDEAGPFPGQIRRVGSQLSDAANRIDRRGFDGLIDDVRTFARRRPVAFIGLAAVTGFAVSRVGRTLEGQNVAADGTGASRAGSKAEGAAWGQDVRSVRWSGGEAPYRAGRL